MDAATVWHVWRRVLREPALQEAMFREDFGARAPEFGLDAAAREVVEQYARTPSGTRFFIANYRYRMTSSFVNALETALPLTHRLLRAHEVDIDAWAVEFLDSVGWYDFGPYVYTYGLRVLEHLLGRPEASIPGLPDLVALEQAANRITIAAAERGVDAEPVSDGHRSIGAVEVVRTERDISDWLRNSSALGRADVPERPRTFLVYLRPSDLRRRIVAVSPRAAAVVTRLRVPGAVRSEEEATAASLVRLGVLLAPIGSD